MMSLRLDPRTKLFLILLCVFCAMFAPNLYFQFALVTFIGLLAVFSGKWQYALRGIIVYALICAFTVWCMNVVTGTWRTMFVAFLGLVHKVYLRNVGGYCDFHHESRRVSFRHGKTAFPEETDYSDCGYAQVSADCPRGLALHQRRHAVA